MSPFRLIILGILFYVFYRLLSGGGQKSQDRTANTAAEPPPLVRDILVEDPVCHTYIPKGQAIHVHDGAETHYFCSEQCRQIFTSKKE